MESLRYIGLSLALGMVAFWGSENFFWSAPAATLTVIEMGMTWAVYTLACACALSAVILTGAAGWSGLFLAGAILGWLVEGVIVGTMYEVFPFQLVWTPLAWHALITAVSVLGLSLASARWSVGAQIGAMAALGLFGAFWSLFWPLERDDTPAALSVLVYLAGTGVLVALALAWIDRSGPLPRPKRWVVMSAPGLGALAWVAGTVMAPSPLRLACPVLIGGSVWIMRRLGSGKEAAWPGPPAPVWRHGLFLIAPLITTAGIALLWAEPGVEVNWLVALPTCAVSVGWWLWLLWRAYGRSAASA
jgi:hypothetical protein